MDSAPFFERALPSDNAAERAVLGSMLLDRGGLIEGLRRLTPESFLSAKHAALFAVLGEMPPDKASDPVLVMHELSRRSGSAGNETLFAELGGHDFLMGLVAAVPSSSRIAHYADLVRAAWLRRQIIATAHSLATQAYDGDQADPQELAAKAIASITKAVESDTGVGDGGGEWADFVSAVEPVEEYGIPTGFSQIDEMTGGLLPGNLIVVAARPSVGKTAWLGSVALNLLFNGVPSFIVSAEMRRRDILRRIACAHAEVDSLDVINNRVRPDARRKLDEAAAWLSARKSLVIWDPSGPSVARVAAEIAAAQSTRGVRVVLIDYLSKLRAPPHTLKYGNRQQEVAQLVTDIKDIAKRTGLPIVLLVQINREGEEEPRMIHLRESGVVEAEADVVLILHRPASEKDLDEQRVEVRVEKSRHGRVGKVEVLYKRKFTRFYPLAPGYVPPPPSYDRAWHVVPTGDHGPF